LIEIGSKTAEKNSAQTNRQTDKQTNRQTDRHYENNGHLAVNQLLNQKFHYDKRKYSFSARIVHIWNSLPNCVADVDTVCLFKACLDKFWMHQDVNTICDRPDRNR